MFYKNILANVLILLVIFSFPGSSLAERVVVGYGYTKTIEAIVINSSVTDLSGNLYIAGNFEGTNIDFDPSGGTDLHTDSGGETNFFTKINSDGSYGYTKILSEVSNTLKLAVDSSGNLYILGYFTGTDVDFDSSSGTDLHTAIGSQDMFLTKINADGSYGYTKTFEGALVYFSPESLVLDSSGNIFLAGSFSGSIGDTADFDPSVGTDVHTLAGESDGFLTKINSDGSYVYTKTFGGALAYFHEGRVAIDSSGNVFFAGGFSGADADFDPSGSIDLYTSVSQGDAFLTKINADGSYEYTKTISGDLDEDIAAIVIDSSDNVYLAGNTTGTEFDLDPTGGSFLYDPNGGAIFIIKINTDGTFGYAKTIDDSLGDSTDNRVNDMVIDSSDNLYIAGTFESDSTDFDPSGGVDNPLNNGDKDIFLTKINVDGSYKYTQTIGGSNADYAGSVSTNASGDIYLGGYFSGTDVDFNPLSGTDLYTSVSRLGFITKISQTTYHHITSLPGTLTAQVSSTEDSVDDTGVDDGILKDAEENIRILHSTVPLADMDTTFSADLDWSTITGESDAVNYKSFVHNLTTVDGADSAFTLYVPYRTGDTAVTVCPGASVLTDVTYTCTGAVSYANGESGVSIVTIGASQFWSIPNQTGTGGISGVPEVVAVSSSTSGSRPRSRTSGFTPVNTFTPTNNTNSNISNTIQKYIFTRTLRNGSIGEDVQELQKYLNANGFTVAITGNGSVGNETIHFGPRTRSALMLFQKSKGLIPDAIMGPLTRGVINAN